MKFQTKIFLANLILLILPISFLFLYVDFKMIFIFLSVFILFLYSMMTWVIAKHVRQQQMEMGKDFVANASHELRTPITVIRGFAETLQDLPPFSEKMLREITGKIVCTCIRLDKLVKSLLTLSDIEHLSLDSFESVNLNSLIKSCKNFLRSAYPDVQIKFKSENPSLSINADGNLLDLAITNLLENAVRYSSSPAHIEINARVEGGQVLIEIEDQGIGIPASDIPHLFDRFYTVDKARSRKSGGAGLGLSIVKTIVEKHRGRVWVVSELDKGSRFTISLPYSKRGEARLLQFRRKWNCKG